MKACVYYFCIISLFFSSDVLSQEDFRLRLYWERGYYWQESRQEKWWCMQCRKSCNNGDSIYLRSCRSDYDKQRFVRYGDTIRPVRNQAMCLTRNGGKYVRFEPCTGASRQMWSSFGRRNKFELTTKWENTSTCLSQDHHPKSGERVYLERCYKARRHDTSFWTMY